MTKSNHENYKYDGGKVVIIGRGNREEYSKKFKEQVEKSLKESRRVIDTIDQMKRGRWDNVHFGSQDTKIEYYKLVQIRDKEKKNEYLENVNRSYSEWVFDLNKHGFERENATRIAVIDTDFLQNALSQTNDSYAIKVTEELQFDESVEENTLQYYKIISKEEPKREWARENVGINYRFQYKNGVRYPLTDLEQAKAFAKEVDGLVVKVTERFAENK